MQIDTQINTKLRVATVWLGGCSGCHMSFLDLDEALEGAAERKAASGSA